jgi:hypothetical protein
LFERGANNKSNLERIELDGNDYLTAKKLNMSGDQYFTNFSKDAWECIENNNGVYAFKKILPFRVNYYFFSEKLKNDRLRSRRRKAERLLAEAKAVMETTGFYQHIYEMIEARGYDVVLAHPLKLKALTAGRAKTDHNDAEMLAELLRIDAVPASYVP